MHALQKVLVMGDVEKQRQSGAVVQLHGQAAVIDAVGMHRCQSWAGRRVWQRGAAGVPRAAIAAIDAQGQVGLVAELVAQCCQLRLQVGRALQAGKPRA
ncbi:hypothetical protein D3C81_1607760 [compost metagenome]